MQDTHDMLIVCILVSTITALVCQTFIIHIYACQERIKGLCALVHVDTCCQSNFLFLVDTINRTCFNSVVQCSPFKKSSCCYCQERLAIVSQAMQGMGLCLFVLPIAIRVHIIL